MLLHHPDTTRTFYLHTDASKYGIAAALTQRDDQDRIRHIAFMSRSLSPSERLYNTTKRELLAIVFGLKKFHHYLYGRKFYVYSDHRALTFLHTQKNLSPLLNTWLTTLLDYQFECVHLPGVLNILPDCLSRLYYPSFRLEGDDDFMSQLEKNELKEAKRIKNREKRLAKEKEKTALVEKAEGFHKRQKMYVNSVVYRL